MNDSPHPIRLSVAILVRDAADALRLTLASIQDVADEVIVLDTGSTDKSREVGREFGARLVALPWTDDFSAARNQAYDHVTGDWLLWLDAGETMSDHDAADLRQFVMAEADPRCGYMLLVRVAAANSQAAEEQIGRIRLLPRNPAVTFSGRVRESCDASLAAAGLTVRGVPYVIRRGEREHDPRLKKKRAQRNIRLAELEHRTHGASARLWNCFGEASQTLGDLPRAAECYRQALAASERGSPEMLEAYYGLLASLDAEREGNTILQRCLEALEIFPLDAQLLCALGSHLHLQGQPALALQSYSAAYRYGQVQPAVWHVPDIRDVAAVCYSVGLQLQQRTAEAGPFLEGALREHPGSQRIRRRLVELYIEQGEREAALVHVNDLAKAAGDVDPLRSAVRGACYASQRNWIAARAYLNAAIGHGCRDVLCLKWLAITLLAGGDREAARPLLEEWRAAEPRNPEPGRLLAEEEAAERRTPGASTPGVSVGGEGRQVRFDGIPGGPGLQLHPYLPTGPSLPVRP